MDFSRWSVQESCSIQFNYIFGSDSKWEKCMLWDLWPINWEKSQFFHWKQQICHFYIEIDLGTILKINFRHCSFHPSMNWIKYWSTTLEMKGANWTFSLKNDQTSNLAGRPGRGDRTKVPEQKLFLFTSSTKTALHPLTFLSYKKSMHPSAHIDSIPKLI